MDLYYLISVFEFVAAFFATIYFKKYYFSKDKYFLHFLWFTFLIDTTGAVLGNILANTRFVYNFFMITSFLFYLYWYNSILEKKLHKQIILGLTIVLLFVITFDVVTISFKKFYKNIFIAGVLFTIVAILFHFTQLLNSNELLNVKRKLSFWISTGLLLFNLGMIPYIYLSDYLKINFNHQIIILIGLNFILYGSYILGFIWSKTKTQEQHY